MNYGYMKDAKFCVASTGRCGSTIMTRFLEKHTPGVFGVHARDFVEFRGKVIFLFGNPMNTAVSTHIEIPVARMRLHYEHMDGDMSSWKNFPREDSLGIEKLFDDWYRQHSFSLIAIRYETMWDHLEEIGEYLGVDMSKFPKKKDRRTNWRTHSRNDEIKETYKRIASKIESAEDISIW